MILIYEGRDIGGELCNINWKTLDPDGNDEDIVNNIVDDIVVNEKLAK